MSEVILDLNRSLGTIQPEIYGHFSEHIGGVFYDGLWVGEGSPVPNIRGFRKALVESFRRIHPPVLRWPGGCFAETYDWRDGIGPRGKRPVRANWWYSYDHRLEPNQVGTHEFMDFCRLVGAEPYIAANMTSLTPLHIRDWMEYCNFPADTTTLARERAANGDREPFNVRFWGIGNENWGGGGQMTPEMYAREYIRYTAVCNSIDKGNLRFILCGPNGHDVSWTRRLLSVWADREWEEAPTWGMSVHYYTGDSDISPDPLNFTEAEWYAVLRKADYMRAVVDDHRAAMNEFDPKHRLAMVVDEWGCWHRDGSGPSKGYNLFEQQSNLRDAVVAALTLNIFNNRCDTVKMANVAQLCNNLHSLYLAGGEHFVETPNYHVFDLFKGHQGGRQIETLVHTPAHDCGDGELPLLSASASEKDSRLTITLVNLSLTEAQAVRLSALGGSLAGSAEIATLAHAEPRTCNTFADPHAVVPKRAKAVFAESAEVVVPAAGVTAITIDKAK